MSSAAAEDGLELGLERYLSKLWGAGVQIKNLQRIPGGASRETYGFDAETQGATRGLILRRDPVGSLIETDRQIEFYRVFVDAKMKDPSVDLGRLLGEPALKTVNEELLTAWAEIKGVYPNLDTETSRAIEHHLCGFDVI